MSKSTGKKAQSAVEFLIVISIALLLIVPATSLMFSKSAEETLNIETNQLVMIGTELLLTAEELHVMAPGSYEKLEVRLPESLSSIRLNAAGTNKGDLVFKQRTPYGENDIVIFSENFIFTAGPTETNICLSEQCNVTGITGGTNIVKLYHNPEGAIRIEKPYANIDVSCEKGKFDSSTPYQAYCKFSGLCVEQKCLWDCQPTAGSTACSSSTANYHAGVCESDSSTGKNRCTK